jgi:hypothetical protein
MHKKHVTDHKIECSSCHTPLRHEIGPIPLLIVISAITKRFI